MDSWAHLVLMAALERVDDTALLRKHIVAELMVRLPTQQPPLLAVFHLARNNDTRDQLAWSAWRNNSTWAELRAWYRMPLPCTQQNHKIAKMFRNAR